MLAVTAELVRKLESYAQKLGLTYPLLADPERDTIRAWGVDGPERR